MELVGWHQRRHIEPLDGARAPVDDVLSAQLNRLAPDPRDSLEHLSVHHARHPTTTCTRRRRR